VHLPEEPREAVALSVVLCVSACCRRGGAWSRYARGALAGRAAGAHVDDPAAIASADRARRHDAGTTECRQGDRSRRRAPNRRRVRHPQRGRLSAAFVAGREPMSADDLSIGSKRRVGSARLAAPWPARTRKRRPASISAALIFARCDSLRPHRARPRAAVLKGARTLESQFPRRDPRWRARWEQEPVIRCRLRSRVDERLDDLTAERRSRLPP
jgi:hypothetical protein